MKTRYYRDCFFNILLWISGNRQLTLSIKFDVSKDCQGKVLDILNEDTQKIESVCNKYGQPVPKLMKFTYEPKTKKFNAEYEYENQTSDDVSVFDNYDAWFEEEQRRLEKMQSR